MGLTPIHKSLISVTEEQNLTLLIYSAYAVTHTYACNSLPSQRNTASCSSLTLYSPNAHTHMYATHPCHRNTTLNSSLTLPMLTPIHKSLISVSEEHNLTLLTYSS